MSEFTSIPNLLKLIDEQVFIKHLEKIIWKGNPISPFDPTSKVYKYANGNYRCKNTGKNFTIKTKTIFENSKLPLWKWFYALHLYSNHKKGVSSHQLAKDIETTQTTAWFILHRLRFVSDIPLFKGILKGIVEIDETYLGGSNSNRHWDKKVPHCQGRNWKDKIPVMVMVKRGSYAIAYVVPNVKKKTLEPIVRENVKEGSDISTDEWLAYKDLGKWYNHQKIIHKKNQYAKGEVSVNSAESFNACLKRTIYGIYHQVSRKHSQKYVDETVMRHNTRNYNEQERFDLLLASTAGRRLTYESLIRN